MKNYDVVIVGGGFAGLSAALQLGRSRRRVLVSDTGKTRNAVAHESHGFFTRDGATPAELVRIGREQLRPYETVELRSVGVKAAKAQSKGFEITLDDETRIACRKLLLATGVVDEMPEIEGFKELWGKSIFNCPYCHGWEVRDQPLALYGGIELAELLKGWSDDLVLCTDGATLSEDESRLLSKNNIAIREERIVRVEEKNGQLENIVFANGETLARKAIFIRPKQQQHSALAKQLGCEFTDSGTVKVDDFGQTSVPGVYAGGDMINPMQHISFAVSRGALAAVGINRALLQEDFR
ncbi:MAG TPA: NAD(P)/FAD-dependent oxidoreductase [Blastocatellia bacterium]|nr:NAD(P)/FAD-dependent oxidoreductase [Blastocatellia bacterium]